VPAKINSTPPGEQF